MTKRINKILWNGTEVPKASTQADGLDGLNLGELFIKNDPQEPGVYTRTTDGKVVLLGGGIDKYLHRLFVAIDANGNKIAPNDTTTPIASVRVNYGLWTEQFLSAKGMNSGGGSSEGGATTLGGLRNVAADADNTFNAAKMLVLEADSNLWTLKNLSELVGLDEDALAEYLTNNNYAKKGDIPSLDGYATEQWVLGKGYATTSDLDARIDALVNGAPQAYDTLKEIADVLANNINSIDDILTALGTKVSKDDFNTAIANVNKSISDLNTELGLKLDAVTFNELFEKVQLEDGTWAIKAKLGLFSDGFISAKGSNVGGTSSEGGAVALYQLNDVLADGTGVSGATDGAVFVYDGKLGKWKGIAQSEIVPNLTGYATESWVLQQGFLTEHQDLSDYAKLSDIPTIPTTDINKGVTAYGWGDHSKVGYLTGITSALVTGALGYTPYDAANFTKANIKSTLGISDWALASSKPSYTTKEVAEDTNLYFTNARAIAALKSITDGLQSDIDTKLDASVFSELFEKVTLEGGVTAIRAKYGLFTDYFLSAKGANSSGGSSSGGGLITSLYRYADLGKTFADTNNDTFNAYTINKINTDLGNRISVLEGKATNVSFTQSLTSGTQIGSISIDGVTKNIYAPTIPTSDINKGVTAYGWGNHASVGYAMASALSGYLPLSGGILRDSWSGGTEIRRTDSNNGYASLMFSQSDGTILGRFGFGGVNNPLFITTEGGYNTLIHSGNIGSQSVNYATISRYLEVQPISDYKDIENSNVGFNWYDWGSLSGDGIYRNNYGIRVRSGDGNIFSYVGFYYGSSSPYIRTIGYGSDSGWKRLAFIEDNVASATKLQTARKLWGQSFNGENDVSGGLSGANFILSNMTNGYFVGNRVDGAGATDGGLMLYTYGSTPISFYANGGEHMRISQDGNVGIGTTNPQYKLDVNGDIAFSSASARVGIEYGGGNTNLYNYIQFNTDTIKYYSGGWTSGNHAAHQFITGNQETRMVIMNDGNIGIGTENPKSKLSVQSVLSSISLGNLGRYDTIGFGNVVEGYGIYLWTTGNGNGHIQVGREDGAAAAYHLCIQELGGNVGIGTTNPQYKLDVNGVIHSTTGIFSDGYVSAKGQNTSSDMRLKNVLNEVVLGVKDIANAPSMRFSWKNGGGVDVGSSAQYWQVLLPDAVKERDGMLEMQYANIALLSAIAIAKNVETHEERISRLERENKELRNEINCLKYGA